MTTLRRLAALAILTLLVAGCSVQLRTQPVPISACDAALAGGRLVADAQSGLAFADAAGAITPVVWPFGYTARREPTGGISLSDGAVVIAREGDWVQAGGGFDGNGAFAVCPASLKVVPPPG